ncbi:MAG: polyphosphate kinase 1, partial [Oscillospiraceae bacterium]|nr:polyphosphate kinase 1 [Oscillospiraceae bacterium]
CCLTAGIEGLTENISVRSIVGRYLEHSRIYIFGRGEDCRLYISSADFMTRNTNRRVEVAAPVYSPVIRKRVLGIFDIMLRDNVKARVQLPDGSYKHISPNENELALSAQQYFIDEAAAASSKQAVRVKVRRKR